MTATERIRAMLDERGVEHFDSTDGTYWGGSVLARDGSSHAYRFSARESVGGLNVHLLRVTPEQAIEATLGKGECQLKRASWDDGTCTWGCICSACDAHLEHDTGIGYNYCPNCGRRVKAVDK